MMKIKIIFMKLISDRDDGFVKLLTWSQLHPGFSIKRPLAMLRVGTDKSEYGIM